MSYYYNPKVTYSSQEDDNFGMSEDSYIDSEPMKASGSVDKESLEYKKRRQKNNEGNDLTARLSSIIIVIDIFQSILSCFYQSISGDDCDRLAIAKKAFQFRCHNCVSFPVNSGAPIEREEQDQV